MQDLWYRRGLVAQKQPKLCFLTILAGFKISKYLKIKNMSIKIYKVIAKINGKIHYPKGFYYQDKHVVLVGCTIRNHTVRRKELIKDVELIIE